MGRDTLLLETMTSTMLSGLSTLRCSRSFATVVVKPHVPMIKFRKNQPQTETNNSSQTPAIATPARYIEKQKKLDTEKTDEETSIINKPFMKNAIFTCHNIQDVLLFAGYEWKGEQQDKKKKKNKKKKDKSND